MGSFPLVSLHSGSDSDKNLFWSQIPARGSNRKAKDVCVLNSFLCAVYNAGLQTNIWKKIFFFKIHIKKSFSKRSLRAKIEKWI